MGDVIRFIPKAERERLRLIREARAIYDSIFPPATAGARRGKAPPDRDGAEAASHNGGIPPWS